MSESPPTPEPVSLSNDGEALVIEWSDGATHRLRWSILREGCPCAACRTKREQEALQPPGSSTPADATTGEQADKAASIQLPVLRPEEAQPIRPTSMTPMGNYAYHIAFNDGHNSGIYTLEYLRLLGEHAAKS